MGSGVGSLKEQFGETSFPFHLIGKKTPSDDDLKGKRVAQWEKQPGILTTEGGQNHIKEKLEKVKDKDW